MTVVNNNKFKVFFFFASNSDNLVHCVIFSVVTGQRNYLLVLVLQQSVENYSLPFTVNPREI